MNIEQEARDLLARRRMLIDTQEQLISANNKLFDSRNETHEVQAAFDAFRREVSEAVYGWFQHGSDEDEKRLCRFIIPEPVDPLDIMFNQLGVSRPDFDAALAKIGGQVVFGEV